MTYGLFGRRDDGAHFDWQGYVSKNLLTPWRKPHDFHEFPTDDVYILKKSMRKGQRPNVRHPNISSLAQYRATDMTFVVFVGRDLQHSHMPESNIDSNNVELLALIVYALDDILYTDTQHFAYANHVWGALKSFVSGCLIALVLNTSYIDKVTTLSLSPFYCHRPSCNGHFEQTFSLYNL